MDDDLSPPRPPADEPPVAESLPGSGSESFEFDTIITDSPSEAAAFVRRSLPVGFPTETVYGLAAAVFDVEGIRRIYQAKGRPSDNPLIAHIADVSEIEELASEVPPAASRLIRAFFPGPLTLVLPRLKNVPSIATASLPTIGIRMPDHELARAFIREVGTPVVAPSANRSGRPSPTTWQAVRDDLGGRISCILRGDRARAGLESTVVDCSDGPPVILRPGSVTEADIRRVVPEVRSAVGEAERLSRSPGTRFRHYAPEAAVTIVDDPTEIVDAEEAAYIGLDPLPEGVAPALFRVCDSTRQYAFELFDFLRACDRRGVQRIYCQRPAARGIGIALLDRLERAAASS